MKPCSVAILGAGAMGAIAGAHLARAGHHVTVIARGHRAGQVREQGLRLAGLAGFTVTARVIEQPAELKQADLFIVATKAIDTAAALAPFAHVRIGAALSLQNGVMKDSLLCEAFGRDTVLGALANISGELQPDGTVLFTRNVSVPVGELDGTPSSRARSIAQVLDASGIPSGAVTDIQSREWSKFAGWAGFVGPAISIRGYSWQFLMDPDGATLAVRLIREIGALADACGIALTDESMFPVASLCSLPEAEAVRIIQRQGEQFRDSAPRHRLSTLQDVESGRALEVQETLGYALARARDLKVRLPLLDAVHRIASAIDRLRAGPQAWI